MTRVLFVCWGNICRSPMAEQVFRAAAADAGLGLEVDSAGTSREELGNAIDARAAAVLRRHGYDVGRHRAHQVSVTELTSTDLVVAMEPLHVDRMRALAGASWPAIADRVALLTDFDPAAVPGSSVPDPWYGSEEGFEDTLAAIEAAVPGLLAAARRVDTP